MFAMNQLNMSEIGYDQALRFSELEPLLLINEHSGLLTGKVTSTSAIGLSIKKAMGLSKLRRISLCHRTYLVSSFPQLNQMAFSTLSFKVEFMNCVYRCKEAWNCKLTSSRPLISSKLRNCNIKHHRDRGKIGANYFTVISSITNFSLAWPWPPWCWNTSQKRPKNCQGMITTLVIKERWSTSF